jgi:glycosyltransferase involved in cell wall biosynthesis
MPKRIAVITTGVKLGNEEQGYTRFLSLSKQLVAAGFEVDLITSAFQHWEKTLRKTDDPALHDYPFKVVFIDEPGYQRNIDLKRIASHRKAAQNLRIYLDNAPPYDLVYCEIPPNDIARQASEYAHDHTIPFIVDVNDLWPEAMRMVFSLPVISTMLFAPFARDARITYQNATGIVGTSDEYARHPFNYRPDDIEHLAVYVGNELEQFDAYVKEHISEVSKREDEFWVTYAGTLGASYDIKTMLYASDELKRRGYTAIKTLIIGGGPYQEQFEELAHTLDGNTTFVGYLDYPQMAAYLACSDVLVNSLVRKAPQSIVNKIADYTAAGKPLINTGESLELKTLIEREDIGINVQAENTEVLVDAIESLFNDPERRENMGRNARHLAAKRFDRSISYQQIIDLITRQTNA